MAMAAMNMVSAGGFSGVSYLLRWCPQGVASVLCKKTSIFGFRRSKLDHMTVLALSFFFFFLPFQINNLVQFPLVIIRCGSSLEQIYWANPQTRSSCRGPFKLYDFFFVDEQIVLSTGPRGKIQPAVLAVSVQGSSRILMRIFARILAFQTDFHFVERINNILFFFDGAYSTVPTSVKP
jgi:hypothetical protein